MTDSLVSWLGGSRDSELCYRRERIGLFGVRGLELRGGHLGGRSRGRMLGLSSCLVALLIGLLGGL